MGKYYRQRHYHNGRTLNGKFDRPWTFTERDWILAAERPPDRVLAEQLGRTVNAIQAERRRARERRQSST